MRLNLTKIARTTVYLIATAVVSVCGIFLPELAREEAVGKTTPPISWPFLVGAWIISLPIFIALSQILKLISYVNQNKAFSDRSVKSLQIIKYCSITFSVLIVIATTTILVIARSADPAEDMPPIPMFGTILVFISSLVTTFVAILQRLLQDAIRIKSQNDLTV